MSDLQPARDALAETRAVTVLSGAGVSAESGVPTFRGAGGLWRRFSAQDLASPDAWARDPGLVWEFYDYRRQIMEDKRPNPAHRALAELEARLTGDGGRFSLVTQNIDGLHAAAESKAITRLHGSLWHVRCLGCGTIEENHDVPITPAYEGAGDPSPDAVATPFSEDDLPRCGCGGIQRPDVVWFGEALNPERLAAATRATACDVFLVVGTSAVVYPAAGLIPMARDRGATIIEVNLEATPATALVDIHLQGPAGEILPELL